MGTPKNFIGLTGELDRPIYRFLAFERLIEIFRTGKFALTRTDKWDDPFENYIIRVRFKSGNGTLDLGLRRRIYGSCWTQKSVSDALWRIYSVDKLSVRIASTPRIIAQALGIGEKAGHRSWFIGKVAYLPQSEIVKNAASLARKILTSESEIAAARSVLFKRRSFTHEAEVRVLVIDRGDRRIGGIVTSPLDPHAVIRSVMLDSRTPKGTAEMYRRHLRDHLGFRGPVKNSKLYDLPARLVIKVDEDGSE